MSEHISYEFLAPRRIVFGWGRRHEAGMLARTLGRTAVLLSPFMPAKSRELWEALGGDGDLPALADYDKLDFAGRTVRRGAVLFPKVES